MPEERDGATTQKIPTIRVPEQTLGDEEAKPQVHESFNGHDGSVRVQQFQSPLEQSIVETPRPVSLPAQSDAAVRRKMPKGRSSPSQSSKMDDKILELERQCRQLYLSIFFREHGPLRSIGFTSSLEGEGKSVLSMMTARVLADDTAFPVTLLDCNWQHPKAHEYFDFAPTPGLAEWLRGECSQTAGQRQVTENLTVIPAGNSERDAVILLQKMRNAGVIDTLVSANGLVVVDLPPIMTTPYGVLAAGLVEGVFIVARAGVTPEAALMETCKQLAASPVEGLVLYQSESRIPGWLRQIL